MEFLAAAAIPVAVVISVFAFVAVATWSENRRKEREEFHRHETYQKMLEQPGENAGAVGAMIEQLEQQRRRDRAVRQVEGFKVASLILTATGIGLMVFLYFLLYRIEEPVYLVGLIPIGIGLAMGCYGFVLAPSPDEPPKTS